MFKKTPKTQQRKTRKWKIRGRMQKFNEYPVTILFALFFWDRVLLCSLGWPWTRSSSASALMCWDYRPAAPLAPYLFLLFVLLQSETLSQKNPTKTKHQIVHFKYVVCQFYTHAHTQGTGDLILGVHCSILGLLFLRQGLTDVQTDPQLLILPQSPQQLRFQASTTTLCFSKLFQKISIWSNDLLTVMVEYFQTGQVSKKV